MDVTEEVCEDVCDGPFELSMEVPISENKMKEINIKEVDSGFIVRVGCQTMAIESAENLVKRLSEYILDPSKVEDEYYSNKRKLGR